MANHHNLRKASQTKSVEVEAEPLTMHQLTHLLTDLLKQRWAHFGMALDLINKS